jgi:hypothetical protein
MTASRVVVYISSESELAQKLRDAAEDGEAIIIDTDDVQYEVEVHIRWSAEHPDTSGEQDSILELMGIADSGEPSNIARFKDQYIADAIDPRPR